ncbi:caspase family protein [Calothrix sp. PCC 6303]|uniref:caspase family protein n=1 Tax=Calothrix sp. PCC 6303 TaxID=1170562 RepID=UPI0002A03065|nr:caspase family protein [Calothrix sp. PCC 6303]AFZ01464.1 peptidase C14 caspase catalytic subunit p20 [Calothrix sp. PCC 6303]
MGKYALLIGIDTYGEGLQPLPAASKDVAALREVLLNPQMGGFDEAKPMINPTQSEMAREIELWFQDRQPEDLVLLFFSGHGVKDDRRDLYFAAANTEKQRDRLLVSTAIPARFIHDCIRSCKAKYQVLILDCCFSGAFGDSIPRDDGEIPLKEQLGAEGRVVLTSTSAVDYSFEEKGADLSIYTRYLVEGIATGAADENEDGVITVDELHRYAGRKVKETSPVMSPTLITLKDEGFRIRVARSPQDAPSLKYRKEVEQIAAEDEGEADSILSRHKNVRLRIRMNGGMAWNVFRIPRYVYLDHHILILKTKEISFTVNAETNIGTHTLCIGESSYMHSRRLHFPEAGYYEVYCRSDFIKGLIISDPEKL